MWNVMCNVSKVEIDVDNRKGVLHTPEMNYPDMRSTINCFKRVDPKIEVIFVVIGGELDMAYAYDKSGREWYARNMKEMHHAVC